MSFRVGERVVVSAHWSAFARMKGEVTLLVDSHFMVRLDGELFPVRFGAGEIRSLESGAAELRDAIADATNHLKGR
ncbi:MAG: hypothetical protein JWP97_5748 [Labilithrix sp.]|nr:hypothetical protein [Labilithrix sp.]